MENVYTLTLFFLLVGCISFCRSSTNLQPSEPFDHHTSLVAGDIYELFWNFDDETITFEVHVQTTGYVGFGISPNGGMKDSDIVIGWVKDGTAYFKDRFAEDHGQKPTVDPRQDWTLLSGTETAQYTILKFRRNLAACDPRDRSIGDNTVRVIWAYHPDDPTSEDAIAYHGNSRRGTKSLYLIQHTPMTPPAMPNDTTTLDFLNPNVSIPTASTTYWCQGFNVPSMTKHHVIKMETMVQAGHENLVHHLLLYECSQPMPASHHGKGADCFDQGAAPEFMQYCRTKMVYVWAIGSEGVILPANVGLVVGGTNATTSFVLEMHYDNPTESPSYVDSSGVRFTMTPTLRTHDMGVLLVGASVFGGMVIPPHYDAFHVRHVCSTACLSEHLPDEGIKVFASMLHAHLLGVEIQVYHFRNGVQLTNSNLGSDTSYDFNYQEYRTLKNQITIMKNDTIIIDCVFKSTSLAVLTYGGDSTHEEMCLNFLLYYPRTTLAQCMSHVPVETMVRFVNDDIRLVNDATVSEPIELANRTWEDVLQNDVNWNQTSERQRFQDFILHTGQYAYCNLKQSSDPNVVFGIRPAPNITIVDDPPACDTINDGNSASSLSIWGLTIILATFASALAI